MRAIRFITWVTDGTIGETSPGYKRTYSGFRSEAAGWGKPAEVTGRMNFSALKASGSLKNPW
jgi:hypothetical protein